MRDLSIFTACSPTAMWYSSSSSSSTTEYSFTGPSCFASATASPADDSQVLLITCLSFFFASSPSRTTWSNDSRTFSLLEPRDLTIWELFLSWSWVYLSAASPETNSSLTTPSWILSDLVILMSPSSPVFFTWVPPHASTSRPSMLTILTSLTGTTPPWYILNPYFCSASPRSNSLIETGMSLRIALFAKSSILVISSSVRLEWCVMSSLA